MKSCFFFSPKSFRLYICHKDKDGSHGNMNIHANKQALPAPKIHLQCRLNLYLTLG